MPESSIPRIEDPLVPNRNEMHLTQEANTFLTWTRQVLNVFYATRPWTTSGVIAATATAGITKLLAFFLPLKVILLAGSPGVPRYFPFIDPADKFPWIIGLTIGAFVFYGLTLQLEARAARWSEGASGDILGSANEMAVRSDEDEHAQKAYQDFCGVCANGLFVILGSLALAFLNPILLGFLATLVALQYAFTAWALSGDNDGVHAGPLKVWIRDRRATYLNILGSANFLLGFLVILAPYLLGAGGNILLAILSLLIMRQVLSALTGIPNVGTRLTNQKLDINTLFFPDEQQASIEKPVLRQLRDLFSKPARQARTAEVLRESLEEPGLAVDVCWADPPVKFLSTLSIRADKGDASTGDAPRWFQQQIFMPKSRAMLENEDFLFRHVERAALNAPRQITRFSEGPFECQLLDYGQGRRMKERQWGRQGEEMVRTVLACSPPWRLVQAFRRSHRMLPQRLQDERLLERLTLAVDTDQEAHDLDAFCASLGEIAQRLDSLPPTIDNRDLTLNTCILDAEGQPYCMTWGRWTLEPFGGTIMTNNVELDPAAELPATAQRRGDCYGVDGAHVELARRCRLLEYYDQRRQYKAALACVADVLAQHAATRPVSSTA